MNTITIATEAAEAAQRGIAFLDHHVDDWREQVNVAALDMLNDCVLMQLYGTFGEGVYRLDLTNGLAFKLGFDADYRATSYDYEDLTNAWKEALS